VLALPTGRAMLELAPHLLEMGEGQSAELALPLYIRDKVALTTQERALNKQQS
jgi:tRNA threonylcarbamoyladenosine biosynthesis protein TsaB